MQLPDVKVLTAIRVAPPCGLGVSRVVALTLALLASTAVVAHAASFDHTYYFSCSADTCFDATASSANNAIRFVIADVENFKLSVGASPLSVDQFASQADQNYPTASCKDIVPGTCVQYTMTAGPADGGSPFYTNPYYIGVAWLNCTGTGCFDPGIIGLTDNFSQVTVALVDCIEGCPPPVLLKAPGEDGNGSYVAPGLPGSVFPQTYYPTLSPQTLEEFPIIPEPATLLLVGFGSVAGIYRRHVASRQRTS